MRPLLLGLALVLGSAVHAQDPVPLTLPDTTFRPSGTFAGTPVSIPLRIGADVTGRAITAADIVVRFDPEVVAFTTAEPGDLIPSGCVFLPNVADPDEEGFQEVRVGIACAGEFEGGPGTLLTLEGTLVDFGSTELVFVDRTPFNEGNVAAELEDGVLTISSNTAPTVTDPIGDQTLEVDGPAFSVDLADVFEDDGDALTFSAGSSDTDIATTAVSGSLLTVTPVASGVATITVTATDEEGLSAGDVFDVVLASVAAEPGQPAAAFALRGNYPNPFAGSTRIAFDLPTAAAVRVEVFDALGRRVVALPEQQVAAGTGRSLLLRAPSLRAGAYVYRIEANSGDRPQTATGRFVVTD